MVPTRSELIHLIEDLEAQLRRLGVEVVLDCASSVEALATLAPDVVILATGSQARPGSSFENAFDGVIDPVGVVTRGPLPEGPVLVYDGGQADWRSTTVAERFVRAGSPVTIASQVVVGQDLDEYSRHGAMRRLSAPSVSFLDFVHLEAVRSDGTAVIRSKRNDVVQELGPFTVVVDCSPNHANVPEHLKQWCLDTATPYLLAGDALAPRRAIDAIWDGVRIGLEAEGLVAHR
jgi:hypothetical protein